MEYVVLVCSGFTLGVVLTVLVARKAMAPPKMEPGQVVKFERGQLMLVTLHRNIDGEVIAELSNRSMLHKAKVNKSRGRHRV